jgi:RHS repeat-associated protein
MMAKIEGGVAQYYHQDHLSVRTMTDSSGNVCYEADFYPFGGERVITNSCPQNYKFQGKERDTETGNDDFGARYYSSSTGRWLSPDWSAIPAPVPYANLTNPQTLNLYAMVCNNPETFADVDGHLAANTFGITDGVDYTGFSNGEGQQWESADEQYVAEEQTQPPQQQDSSAAAAVAAPVVADPPVTTAPTPTATPTVGPTPPPTAPPGPALVPLLLAATAVVVAADIFITRTTDAIVANYNDQAKRDAADSRAAGENAAALAKSRQGLPPDAVKLKGNQGYRDKSGNTWKKDKLHKDHWDVTDRKGKKVREVTFDGRILWPNGPKNNQ